MASFHARSHTRHVLLHANQEKSSILHVPAATVPDHASPVDLFRRQATSASTGSSSGGSNITVPVTVGVIVPIAIALVIFFYLHRRHVKRLRLEDQNDPHKSLDFGMDPSNQGKTKRGGKSPEMAQEDFEKSLRRGRGMSMDMGDISNPYLLPPGMHSSRESLHSLSRTVEHGYHDPYRPATTYIPPGSSSRQGSRFDDSSSTRTGSTGPRFGRDGMNSNSNLLRNAQKFATTSPISPSTQTLQSIEENTNQPSTIQRPQAAHTSPSTTSIPPPAIDAEMRDSYSGQDAAAIRQSNNYLAGIIQSREPSIERSAAKSPDPKPRSPDPSQAQNPPQASSPPTIHNFSRKQSLQRNPVPSIMVHDEPMPQALGKAGQASESIDSLQQARSNVSSPTPNEGTPFFTPTEEQPQAPAASSANIGGLGVFNVIFDSKRLSIMRPLPPDDPRDDPEQRANRIRSFYKEYFRSDEPARAYQPQIADYYEDYGQEYLGDGAIYDPDTGGFVVAHAPYAEPVTRRAMTPPPRGPPRFQGRSHQHNNSNPGPVPGRSRAFSSASTSRMGPGGPRGVPKPPMPPPSPLRTLPTPYLLKDDSFITTLPIDFAPPSTFRDQASGRPESPRGSMRPYSPQVPIASSPLASSFNELPAMPSPHHLRKSGTFTALDFAPPPRLFRNDDGASDAGSIRSGRSNHSARSAAQVHNIRAGAYRLSRIPTELVGTQTEFKESLRPTWKVGS